MKPFNPTPNAQRPQWIRTSNGIDGLFHARVMSVKLPQVRVQCGAEVETDRNGLYEFYNLAAGESAPYNACLMCRQKVSAAA